MLPPCAMMPSVCGRRERTRHVLDQAAPALEDAEARPSVIGELLDDGTDDGVQTRAVTAAGEQADLHRSPILSSGGLRRLSEHSVGLARMLARRRPVGSHGQSLLEFERIIGPPAAGQSDRALQRVPNRGRAHRRFKTTSAPGRGEVRTRSTQVVSTLPEMKSG